MAGTQEETSSEGHVTIQVLLQGRVQGVGFRWFVRRHARRLQLAGWVANLPDGCVRVTAHGPGPAIDGLREAILRGPPGARVDRAVFEPPEPTAALPDPFQIR